MDISRLDSVVEFYFQRSVANSTQKTYASAQSRYLSFCSQFLLTPLPVSESQLCRFVSFLATEKVSHSSTKTYLSAVRHLQVSYCYPDPQLYSMPKLQGVVRGIKSQQARTKNFSPKRLPITTSVLRRLRAHLGSRFSDPDMLMIWAASSVCFFGFLRAGELTVPSDKEFDPASHLCFSDISIDDIFDPQIVKLHLKSSKTDPFRKGVDVVLGRTNNELCPVTALLAYMAQRGNSPGCLFKFVNGSLLTKQRFVKRVRDALSGCGLDPAKFAGHSFRIGAATSAGLCGMNDSTIKMLGRWESSAYQVYIKTPRDALANFSAVLGNLKD